MQIGIIGSAGPEEYPKNGKPCNRIFNLAEKTGKLIAKSGAILITGGKRGIMESSSRGAKKQGGITVGIISGNKRGKSNKFIDVEIVSNMLTTGEESTLISCCDGIIAIGGGAGTLQELAIAYRTKKPIVAITGVNGYSSKFAGKYLDDRKLIKIKSAKTPKEAVSLLMRLIK